MLKSSSLAKWGVAAFLLSSLSSCEDIFEKYFPKPNPTPPTIPTFPPLGQDIAFYALSGGNRLDGYSTANATTRISSVAITGLQGGEALLAIDFRPATGQLYGVSSASRLYVINQNTGAARAIGSGAFTPAVAGNLVGFDFNPTVDRIRLVTSTGQNLRLNPETGTVAATDGVLNGAAGATITGAAYTNNTAGATTTVLYDLDPATDQLYRQDPPNDGKLVAVGPLNLNISGNGGFDIDDRTGTALGLYAVNGNPTLFTVDLTTGAARPLAQYAANTGYTGIAIPTRFVAYGVTTTVSGQNLVILNLAKVNAAVFKVITGLGTDETVVALDFRPATGQLYALTGRGTERVPPYRYEGRLYTIDPATGAATFVATVNTPLEGATGFDFNPVVDRLRITSSTGQNLRVNPTDGVAIVDSPLNIATAPVFKVAYTNSFAGATSTSLYAIGVENPRQERPRDQVAILSQVNSPNEGTVTRIRDLGISQVSSLYSFDIGGTTNTGYTVISDIGNSTLYQVDLTSGRITRENIVGQIENSSAKYQINGLAVGLGF